MLGRSTEIFTEDKRSVKLPGQPAQPMADDPVLIARALRKRSALGKREALQAAAESKRNG